MLYIGRHNNKNLTLSLRTRVSLLYRGILVVTEFAEEIERFGSHVLLTRLS